MRLALIFRYVFSSMSFGADSLGEGECISLPTSKRYVDFNSSTTYPKSYTFTCDIQCKARGEVSTIKALHEVVVRNVSGEAKDVVCHGVRVKRVSWGYDFDRVDKFFIYEAGLSKLTLWGKSQDISLDHENSSLLMSKLLKDLMQVLSGYRVASQSNVSSARPFGVAADLIELLLTELPRNTQRVDQLILEGLSTDIDEHTGRNLVLRVLSSSAKWRLNYLKVGE